jgi:DNA-binding GntR family transcriptional regulator
MAAIFTEGESGPAVARRRSVLDVTESLRRGITAGTFHPNERLVEEELARKLDTNRAVVRSALACLEQECLVVREPNRGARVRAFSPEEAAEILETRAALEGLVARRAAERLDASDALRLEAIVAEMREHQAEGDLESYSAANARFHRAISAIADHATARKLLTQLQSQAVRYQFRTVLAPGRSARSLAEHEAIFAALVARDADAAERTVRAHIAAVIATVRKSFLLPSDEAE